MPECFMIREVQTGGGNRASQSRPEIIIRRVAAFGDVVAATIIADRLHQLGYRIQFQSHGAMHPVLKRHPHISRVENPGGYCHVNLDGAYERHPLRRSRHFYSLFFESAANQLRAMGITLGGAANAHPRLVVPPPIRHGLRDRLDNYPKPWIFICPRSDTYRPRQVPDYIWEQSMLKVEGTKFWVGRGQAPPIFVDLRASSMEIILDWLSVADLLVTPDTGPMHLANAVGTKVLALGQSSSPELHLSDQTDFITIFPKLDCLNCQLNLCPVDEFNPPCQKIDPEMIGQWTVNRLRSIYSEDISAVIPIYKPGAEMLNRCLEAVLPQVNEVIVTRENGGVVPEGTIQSPKIVHVRKAENNIGFGRNVNFGVRHSRGKYVLVLNDDVYLAPDAVARMMEVMKPGVGAVGHLTRYPDGTIYHAGKLRQPGDGIGFPHLDLRRREPTIKQPVEMENTNGASILFRREAFYDASGYDEDFLFYCEDDDICMKIRQAGWRIWYTPHATGIHDEHRETSRIQGINQIMHESNARFGRKWGAYFRHNAANTGLGNFDYLK